MNKHMAYICSICVYGTHAKLYIHIYHFCVLERVKKINKKNKTKSDMKTQNRSKANKTQSLIELSGQIANIR